MANPWDPERTVSPELAQELIEAAFSNLTPVRVASLGHGWDNTGYLVNEAIVFRFPRRQSAVSLLNTENQVLPELASRVPLPVPVPKWIGKPSQRFPWPFAGYRILPGRPVLGAGLDDEARWRLAKPLAEFLKALHSIPTADAQVWGIETDSFHRLDIRKFVEKILPRLHDLAERKVIEDLSPLLRIVEEAPASVPNPRILLHGDLEAEHLLVDNSHSLTGIIDWGDVQLGHPSLDLAVGWNFFSPEGRQEFFAAYGPIDDETMRLSRLRALWAATIWEAYGRDRRDFDRVSEARSTLRRLL